MRPAPPAGEASHRLAEALRDSLARDTRRGLGMTMASCAYWAALAGVVAWAGFAPRMLALFFLVATALVYPFGWVLNRACGGDLLARRHPFARLVWVLGATQALGWPTLGIVFAQAPALLAFALAALLGAHFLPYGWLYRSPSYYALGIGSVLLAAWLQWQFPRHANLVIPLAMLGCYALATLGVWRENRGAARAPC